MYGHGKNVERAKTILEKKIEVGGLTLPMQTQAFILINGFEWKWSKSHSQEEESHPQPTEF